ncbi:MAG: hypothetical protein JRH01_00100 [Deltaproteobacteria bacterium]|nr:hypothetical protein [Deltaproteobacteria bacterium]MBW2392799.1 hypothetical protein [Deltaproteobacteria bacterium]
MPRVGGKTLRTHSGPTTQQTGTRQSQVPHGTSQPHAEGSEVTRTGASSSLLEAWVAAPELILGNMCSAL